eukprot:gb/GFBE01020027.1/.p1 GENE.gb/GFBE01020027.1/~~gb/GFBE01020027.1/.p1  ORF type:complete len:446 (+),score=94.66 gb/GFBE01020027.1/:1-1338(+)
MAGKTGTVIGRVGEDIYSVRLGSGSIFNIKADNLSRGRGGRGGGRSGGGSGGGSGSGSGRSGTGGPSGDVFGWLLPGLAGLVLLALLRQIKRMSSRRSPSTSTPLRLDFKPVQWTRSTSMGTLATLLLLAAFILLPELLAWFQRHFPNAVTESGMVIPRFFAWLQDLLPSAGSPKSLSHARDAAKLTKTAARYVMADSGSEEPKHRFWTSFVPAILMVVFAWNLLEGRKKSDKKEVKPKSAMAKSTEKGMIQKGIEYLPKIHRKNTFHLPDVEGSGSASSTTPKGHFIPGAPGSYTFPGGSEVPYVSDDGGLSLPMGVMDYNIDLPKVIFQVQMHTAHGDRLLVVGGDPSLGEWDPERTQVELFTDEQRYPIWSGSWRPPKAPSDHAFKLVLEKTDGKRVWEEIEDRRCRVLPNEIRSLQLIFDNPAQHAFGTSRAPTMMPVAGG